MRPSDEGRKPGDEVLLIDLRIGDRFAFDDFIFTVVEPPQCNWGIVEVWVQEQDWPFEGGEISTVWIAGPRSPRTS